MVSSKSIRGDHFKPTVEACYKYLDVKTAKMAVNCAIGELRQPVRKTIHHPDQQPRVRYGL